MKVTPNLLASFVGGTVDGDGDIEITGFAKIEEAAPGQVSFIANPKYAHYIHTTGASVVLVSRDFDAGGASPVLVRVDDPYAALAELLTAFEKMKPRLQGVEQPCFIGEGVSVPDDAYIGAFAYIGAGASLGAGVMVYPQAYIGRGVSLGEGSVVYPGARIYDGCRIGRRCIIHAGAVVGADGFGFAPTASGYEKIPQIGIVEIADDVEVGANTCIDRATFGATRVGRGTKLDNLIQIGHNVELGEDNVLCAQVGVAGSTKIADRNRVGGQTGIAGHLKIGSDIDFGAHSGVHKNPGDGAKVLGYPAVDARQFAKTQVYLKKLHELFADRKQ